MIKERGELTREELAAQEAAELPDREELSLLSGGLLGGVGPLPVSPGAGQGLPGGQGLPTQSLPAGAGVPQLGLPLPG
jgi:hypothetical protein